MRAASFQQQLVSRYHVDLDGQAIAACLSSAWSAYLAAARTERNCPARPPCHSISRDPGAEPFTRSLTSARASALNLMRLTRMALACVEASPWQPASRGPGNHRSCSLVLRLVDITQHNQGVRRDNPLGERKERIDVDLPHTLPVLPGELRERCERFGGCANVERRPAS